MIGHDHERMKFAAVEAPPAVAQSFDDHVCDRWLRQKPGANAALIE
jgi:hypothetical protein